MSVKQIKIQLIEKGLSIAEIARDFSHDSNATIRSLETMIADTLYGRRYFPAIAEKLNRKYGIKVERPLHLQPIRKQLKQVA